MVALNIPLLSSLSSPLFNRGVRPRIALSFGSLGLALMVLLGLLAAQSARQESKETTERLLLQLASSLSAQLDHDMAERYREVALMASYENLHQSGRPTSEWRITLDEMQKTLKDYSWIGVTDTKGKVIAATQGILEGRDVSARPWFEKGLLAPVVLNVHEAKLLANLLPPSPKDEPYRFVDVAAPIKQGDRVIGVIGAHLNWEWARQRGQELLAAIDPDLAIKLVILDAQGKVLLGDKPLWEGRLQPTSTTRELGTQIFSLADGQRYLGAWRTSRPIGPYPGMGWQVILLQPEATALASAQHVKWLVVGLSLLGAALFAALSWWLASALTAPLRAAASQARRDAPPGAQATLGDEVAQLTASLASLTQTIQARDEEVMALNANRDVAVREQVADLKLQNEELRDFRRSVSHDLRGPLGQMALLLKRILARTGQDLPAEVKEKVGVVADECDRLSHLTNDMLALAMVEDRPLTLQTVNHMQLVQQELARLRHSMGHQPLAIDLSPLPESEGDPALLRQVWANLLSNAIKYSAKASKPTIKIQAIQDGDHCTFTVSDNGAGFDPALSSQLFQPFHRLHKAEDFEGTGIGLTIVQRVIERHGGRVWAESSTGGGASFHFRLPTGQPHAHRQAA